MEQQVWSICQAAGRGAWCDGEWDVMGAVVERDVRFGRRRERLEGRGHHRDVSTRRGRAQGDMLHPEDGEVDPGYGQGRERVEPAPRRACVCLCVCLCARAIWEIGSGRAGGPGGRGTARHGNRGDGGQRRDKGTR